MTQKLISPLQTFNMNAFILPSLNNWPKTHATLYSCVCVCDMQWHYITITVALVYVPINVDDLRGKKLSSQIQC